MKYFTSDFHFGESNERLKLFGRDRVGFTAEEFDIMIIDNFNSIISDEDEVYILGDLSKTKESLKKIQLLNGKKHFLIGNYDEEFVDELKYMAETVEGIESVELVGKYISIEDKTIYLNHYPTKAKNDCDMNLVGHIHGLWQVQRNMINVGIDAWNYKPVSEKDILFKIEAIKKFYDQNVFAGELETNVNKRTIDKKIIYPTDIIPNKNLVFLAGPIKGNLNWRKNLIYQLNKINKDFVIANPQLMQQDFNLENQIKWETEAMHNSFYSENGCVIFWLANQEEPAEQSYARTTRFELAEFFQKSKNIEKKNIIVGIDSNFEGKEYIRYRIETESDLKICNNFEEIVEQLKSILK